MRKAPLKYNTYRTKLKIHRPQCFSDQILRRLLFKNKVPPNKEKSNIGKIG